MTQKTTEPIQGSSTATTHSFRLGTTSTALLASSLFAVASGGCAVRYYDTQTGTEHLWGVGHLKMKASAPTEGVRSVVTGSETFGLSLGRVQDQSGILCGWQRLSRIAVVSPDTQLRLEWPNSDFFHLRIGTNWPAEFSTSDAAAGSNPNPGEPQ